MREKALYFYITILAIFVVVSEILLPYILPYTMFVDGITYATIAKNLAMGEGGSFWVLHYTKTLMPEFYAHPPLAFWMQSLFFKVLGTGFFTERLYSSVIVLITGFLVVKIWKELTSEIRTAWLPLLLLIFFLRFIWVAENNMLENTVSLFVCLSIFFYLKSLKQHTLFYLIVSGLALFLGVLTKSVPALFPLTFPFWIWLFSKKIVLKRAITDTFLLVASAILPLVLLYVLSPSAKQFFDNYLSHQLLPSLSGQYVFVESRFHIIWILFRDSIFVLMLISILFVALWKTKKLSTIKKYQKDSLAFIALALCAVLPVMVTLKQANWYIAPAYPFFAIGLALLFEPVAKEWQEKFMATSRIFTTFKWLSSALLVVSILFAVTFNERIRWSDENLQVVRQVKPYIPKNTVISVDRKTWENWCLHAYFARYMGVSLDYINEHTYYLHDTRIDPRLPIYQFILLKEVGVHELRRKMAE